MIHRNRLACILGTAALTASTAGAQLVAADPLPAAGDDAPASAQPRGFSSGPDVLYQSVNTINKYGPVGSKVAYIGDSFTCNVGDAPMLFGFSANGSPGLVFNMYRHHNGRLEQIGMSLVKHACCAAQGSGCGLPCNTSGGLGPGCRDIYSAGWNASQSNLGPRSAINAWTGNMPGIRGVGGSTIAGRLQVEEADMQMEGSGASYFFEGVYVASDDAPAGNAYNNASYRAVNVNEPGLSLSVSGAMIEGDPAIFAWMDMEPSVQIVPADIPGEGRFFLAAKTSDNGDGTHRYEYAIYNLNSHRSAGSLFVPVPAGVGVSGIGFHDVDYHTGEPYDNTDWGHSDDSGGVLWSSPQTFAQNADSNAVRWGTMYNYWFDAASPPTNGDVTVGLFRPGAPDSILVNLPVPSSVGCNGADINVPFGQLDFSDITAFLVAFTNMEAAADLALPIGQWDFTDVTTFLGLFGAGCP